MVAISHSGRGRINLRRPRALAECDRCSLWWNHHVMRDQMQWSGNALVKTGLLVCPECLDVPQPQFQTPILGPDPYPVLNPRVSPNITPIRYTGQTPQPSPNNFGLTQYVLGASGVPGTYPTTKAAVLAQIAALSGIPTPSPISDLSTTVGAPYASQLLVPTPPIGKGPQNRTWMLIYNPSVPQFQISPDAITWGNGANLSVGPGEAWFWASTQYNGPGVGNDPVLMSGSVAGLPIFAWQGTT